MIKRIEELGNLRPTIKTIENDLRLAKTLYYFYTKILAPFNRIKLLRKNYSSLLHYSYWSLDISYIVTLYKIFDKDNVSLGHFICQIKHLSKQSKSVLKDIEKYNKFVKKSDEYLSKIKHIESMLNPLRNTFRAHNFLNRKNPTIKWIQTEGWLNWAEKVFDEALIAVGFYSYMPYLENSVINEKRVLFNSIKK